MLYYFCFLFFFKQKTAYEMRISDWSSDVCSSDLQFIELLRVDIQLLGLPGGRAIALEQRTRLIIELVDPFLRCNARLLRTLGRVQRFRQRIALRPGAWGDRQHREQHQWCADPDHRRPHEDGTARSILCSNGRSQPQIACIISSVSSRSEEHTSELQSLMRISYA